MQIPINVPDDTVVLKVFALNEHDELDVIELNSEQLDHYRKEENADTDCAWRMP